ncbi:MAG: hypothetical protein H0X43_07660 [Nitrosospira sp.]|nr:hypothetical protein [Nitrosospira sp.]
MSLSNSNIAKTAEAHASIYRFAIAPVHGLTAQHSPGVQGNSERPLAIVRRAENKLMRNPDKASNIIPHPAPPQEHYGLVSPSNEESAQANTRGSPDQMGSAAKPDSGVIDPEEIAEQTWRIMAEQLVIEQERRGLTKWM